MKYEAAVISLEILKACAKPDKKIEQPLPHITFTPIRMRIP